MGQAQSQSASGNNCDECILMTGNRQTGQHYVPQPNLQTAIPQDGKTGAQKPTDMRTSGETYSVQGIPGSHSTGIPGQLPFHAAGGFAQPSINPSVPGTATQQPQIGYQGQPIPQYSINLIPSNTKPGDQIQFLNPMGSVYPVSSVYPGNKPGEQINTPSVYPAGSMPLGTLSQNSQFTGQNQPSSVSGSSLPANTYTPYHNTGGQSQSATANFPGSIPYITSQNQAGSQGQPTSVYFPRTPVVGTQYPQGSTVSQVPASTAFQSPQYLPNQLTGQVFPGADQSFLYPTQLPSQSNYPNWPQIANQPINSGQIITGSQQGYPQVQSNIPQTSGLNLQSRFPQGYPQSPDISQGTTYQQDNRGPLAPGQTIYQPNVQSGRQQSTGDLHGSQKSIYEPQNLPINNIAQPQQPPNTFAFTGSQGSLQPQWIVYGPPLQVSSSSYPVPVQGNIVVPNYGGYPQSQDKTSSILPGGSTMPNSGAWFGNQGASIGGNIPQPAGYITQGVQSGSNTGIYQPSYQPGQGGYIARDGSIVPVSSGPVTGFAGTNYPASTITGTAGSLAGLPVGNPPSGGIQISQYGGPNANIPGTVPTDYGRPIINNSVSSNYPAVSSGIRSSYFPLPSSSSNAQPNLNYSNYSSGGGILGGSRGIDVSQGTQIVPVDTEFGESQSLSGIHLHDNDTTAEASAQGKTRNGVAQAQVSGTYTGSFSAQAQTSDNEKSAKTQIFGNKTGAMSTSQGNAGRSQSQSQIQYNYGNGASLAEAQGKGINYATNVQIQAGHRGGLADAQASGPGNTNSQAQIGFVPYDENRKKQQSIFEGGGTASSQSGGFSGQSQTQFQGAFKSGPSFTGAAQASSGSSAQNVTKLSFNSSNLSLLRNEAIKDVVTPGTSTQKSGVIKSTAPLPNPIDSESISSKQDNKSSVNEKGVKGNEEKYKDQETADTQRQFDRSGLGEKTESSQSQDAYIRSKSHDAFIYRDSVDRVEENTVFNSGDIIPGTNNYRVPSGFRGRVMSTAGDKTEAVAAPGGRAQTQTVVLKPGSGRVVKHNSKTDSLQDDAEIRQKNGYDSYVTVTNSETGELNNGNRKYGHTYYSKSSTCGYFTYTCSLIDGTSGRTKICKPGPPTYSDGTPC